MSAPVRRIPQVEGLRAIAAGMVFLTHLSLVTGFTENSPVGPLFARLNLGLALFFAISGYLLYRPWIAARLEGRPRPRTGRYALRRATRILPAYWAALTVLALVLPAYVENVFTTDWWVYYGLLQAYSFDWILGGLRVAWSLSTESAFYASLPLLGYFVALVIGRRSRRGQVRAELVAIAISAPAALVLLDVAQRSGWGGRTLPNTLLGTWPWFAVGMALAVATAAWAQDEWADAPRPLRSARSRPWLWWSAAAVVLLIATSESVLPRHVFYMTQNQAMLETTLFAVITALVVTPVVLGESSSPMSPARLLSIRPMLWLGKVSYGIFLWHLPLISWIAGHYPHTPLPLVGLAAFSATLVCASASWYLIERPMISLSHRRRPGRPELELATSQAAP